MANPPSSECIAGLVGTDIHLDLIWPRYNESLTIASDSTGLFLKTPNVIDVAHQIGKPEVIQARILREAQMCEVLKAKPHQHVVEYAGCLVEDDTIKGLLLKRYRHDLHEWVKREPPGDKEQVMADIRAGIEHLHSIGIVHGDLQPANIMFDDDDNAILIDFDSARFCGELLDPLHKRSKYYTNEATHALPENDHYSLTRLEAFMEGGLGKVMSL